MNRLSTMSLLVVAGLAAALGVAGCGSSQPKYCDLRDAAATQIQAIKDTNVVREGTDALRTRVKTASGTLGDLADQASTDFPSETGALKQSLAAVKVSIDQLGTSGARAEALTVLPGQLRTTAADAQRLRSAVDGTCN